jgi:hypothetical protein
VTEIKILSAVVFVDPIEEAHKLFDDDMERRIAERWAREDGAWYSALRYGFHSFMSLGCGV